MSSSTEFTLGEMNHKVTATRAKPPHGDDDENNHAKNGDGSHVDDNDDSWMPHHQQQRNNASASFNNSNGPPPMPLSASFLSPQGQDVVERYVLSEMGAVRELDGAVEKCKNILELSLFQCARQSLFHIATNRESLQRQQRDFDMEKLRQEFEAKRQVKYESDLKQREEHIRRREEIMVKREEQLASRDRALERVQVFANEDLRRQRIVSLANVEMSQLALEHIRRLELSAAETPQQFFLASVSKYLTEHAKAAEGEAESATRSRQQQQQQDDDSVVLKKYDARDGQQAEEEEDDDVAQQQLRGGQKESAEEMVVRSFHPPHRPPSTTSSAAAQKTSATANIRGSHYQALYAPPKLPPTPFFQSTEASPSFFFKIKREWKLDVCPLHIRGHRAMHVVRELPLGEFPLAVANKQQQQIESSSSQQEQVRRHFQFNVLGNPAPSASSSSHQVVVPSNKSQYMEQTHTTVGEAIFDVELFPPKVVRSFLLLGGDANYLGSSSPVGSGHRGSVATTTGGGGSPSSPFNLEKSMRGRTDSIVSEGSNSTQNNNNNMDLLSFSQVSESVPINQGAAAAGRTTPSMMMTSPLQLRDAANLAAHHRAFKSPSIHFVYFAPREVGQTAANDGALLDNDDDDYYYNDDGTKIVTSSSAAAEEEGENAFGGGGGGWTASGKKKKRSSEEFEDCLVLILGSSSGGQNQSNNDTKKKSGGIQVVVPSSSSASSSAITSNRPQSAPISRASLHHQQRQQVRTVTVQQIIAKIPLADFRAPSSSSSSSSSSRHMLSDEPTSLAAHVDLGAKNLCVQRINHNNKQQQDHNGENKFALGGVTIETSAKVANALVSSGQATGEVPPMAALGSAVVPFDTELASAQVKGPLIAADAELYLGLMLTSPCAAVEFVKTVEQK